MLQITRFNPSINKWELGFYVGTQFHIMATVPHLIEEEDEHVYDEL